MANAPYIDGALWKDSSSFLNWPGLQYLFYTKIKPFYAAIDASILEIRNRLDDVGFYASYADSSTGTDTNGIVFMTYNDDNTVIESGTDGSCGCIDANGELKMLVNTNSNINENGSYIDSSGNLNVSISEN